MIYKELTHLGLEASIFKSVEYILQNIQLGRKSKLHRLCIATIYETMK